MLSTAVTSCTLPSTAGDSSAPRVRGSHEQGTHLGRLSLSCLLFLAHAITDIATCRQHRLIANMLEGSVGCTSRRRRRRAARGCKQWRLLRSGLVRLLRGAVQVSRTMTLWRQPLSSSSIVQRGTLAGAVGHRRCPSLALAQGIRTPSANACAVVAGGRRILTLCISDQVLNVVAPCRACRPTCWLLLLQWLLLLLAALSATWFAVIGHLVGAAASVRTRAVLLAPRHIVGLYTLRGRASCLACCCHAPCRRLCLTSSRQDASSSWGIIQPPIAARGSGCQPAPHWGWR